MLQNEFSTNLNFNIKFISLQVINELGKATQK